MTSTATVRRATLAWRISVPALGVRIGAIGPGGIEAPFRHFRIFADDEPIVSTAARERPAHNVAAQADQVSDQRAGEEFHPGGAPIR